LATLTVSGTSEAAWSIERENLVVEFDQFHLLIVPFGRSDLHSFAFQVGEVTGILSARPTPLDHHDVLARFGKKKIDEQRSARPRIWAEALMTLL
jgi:hypothetical protein